MKEECGSFIAALSVNVVTVNMLPSVFFLSGVWAACDKTSHLSVTTPKKMKALSGSCLQIPCSFRVRSWGKNYNTGTVYGVWVKTSKKPNAHYLVSFNSSTSNNLYEMKIIGDLSRNRCTTLFYNLKPRHTDRYFFKIVNGAFKETARCDPLHITVKDSPQRPRIEISGDVKHLKEKESVTITCSAFTPCPHSPPELTWNLQQDSHRQTEKNTDGTFTTKIQQSITLSDTHDGYTITCSATYPVDGGKRVNTSETLSVSYAPKDTSASISPSGLVSAGSWVKLNCSSRANPPSSFTWFKISKHGDVNVSEGQVYTFNATDGGVYYCVANNNLGNGTSQEILLTFEDAGLWSSPLLSVLILVMVVVVISLVVCVCYFKSKHPTLRQTHSQPGEEFDLQMSANKTEEELHYGDVNFFSRRPEPSSVSVQDSRQQQETVYAQVKVSEPESSSVQTADGPEDLYAQVVEK